MNSTISNSIDNLQFDDTNGAHTIYDSGPAFQNSVPAPNLANLSTRAFVGTGNNVVIGGFIVQGSQPMTVILRGIGYSLRPARPDAAWIGNAQVTEVPDGLRVGVTGTNRDETRVPVAFDTPLYKAGVDEDDVITKIDDQAPTLAAWRAIGQRKPGDTVTLVVRRRDGKLVTTTAKLVADPGVQVVALENAGGTLTDAQRTLREGWLASKVK
jgi:predicted metalloprotease with PDZ domain